MAQKMKSKKATKPKTAKAKATPAPAKGAAMTVEEILRELEALGNAGVRAQNAKWGAGDSTGGTGAPAPAHLRAPSPGREWELVAGRCIPA